MGNINQAGLPQAQQSAGGMPIGSLMALPPGGMLQRLADGSMWLRTGVIIAKALAPLGQLCEYLRAHIFVESASAAPAANGALFVCTNGLGTYVIGFGSADANVYVSNDFGLTWTARASNISVGTGPCSMCWTGSYFIGVNNNGPVHGACSSPDGITWTASTTGVTSGGTLSANTERVIWTGTTVFATAIANTASGGGMTSPTGLSGTWTSRGVAATVNQPQLSASAHGTIMQFGTSVQTSDQSAAVWTVRTPPTTPLSNAPPLAFSDKFVLFATGTTTIQSVDQGVTWSAPVATGVEQPNLSLTGKTPSGRVFGSCLASSQIVYTDDGVFWKIQGYATANPASNYPGVTAAMIATDGTASMVFVTTGGTQKVQYSRGSFNNSTGVGTGLLASTGSGGSNLFAKVK